MNLQKLLGYSVMYAMKARDLEIAEDIDETDYGLLPHCLRLHGIKENRSFLVVCLYSAQLLIIITQGNFTSFNWPRCIGSFCILDPAVIMLYNKVNYALSLELTLLVSNYESFLRILSVYLSHLLFILI